jgi:CDGSH-type Zn-finger protein
MEEPKIARKSPYPVELKEGQKYAWCACGLSKNQPFCDASHKTTSFKPHIFVAESSDKKYLCGCKQTQNAPFCDGTHNKL